MHSSVSPPAYHASLGQPPAYDAPPPFGESKSLVAKLADIPVEIKSDATALYQEI